MSDDTAQSEYGCPADWVYRDVSWCIVELWNKLVDMLGEGNYFILARTTRTKEGFSTARGQMMVSPQGMQNLLDYHTLLQQDKEPKEANV